MNAKRAVTNRLERSTDAKYRTIKDLVDFCNAPQNPISFTESSDCIDKVAPTDDIKSAFMKNFTMDRLPPTNFREQGASPVLVFEPKHFSRNSNVLSNHGELCAAIAHQVGHSLVPGVDSLYIHKSVDPNYRKNVELDNQADVIKKLVENQGVPVINTSIGWQDISLGFTESNPEQANHLWRVTAFVVDSAGNNGGLGANGKSIGAEQKHNAISHFAPLAVHVGAAEMVDGDNTKWVIPGYSSANSPTFLAPASATLHVHWREDDKTEPAIGTSTAAPYASGVLAALNNRYGSYLTREQILYAVLATCTPIKKVTKFADTDEAGNLRFKTEHDKIIEYKPNSAGLSYNPEYGGFGLIHPHNADRLLCHMVDIAKQNPDGITVPTEQLFTMLNCKKHQAVSKDNNGNDIYQYKVNCENGIALKTTIEADFVKEHGDITITSPSGTTVPMVMSKLRDENTGNIISTFAMSTSHAWAGENLHGDWTITSTKPLKRLRLNQDHFQSNDIVKELNKSKVDELEATPAPYMSLGNAIPLVERIPQLRVAHERTVPKHGTTINGYAIADTDDINIFTEQLYKTPTGFEHNYANAFRAPFFNSTNPDGSSTTEGTYEKIANKLTFSLEDDAGKNKDDIRYGIIKNRLAAVDVYNAQGNQINQIIPLCSTSEQHLACTSKTTPEGKFNSDEAIRHFKQALKICEENSIYDKAEEITKKLYNVMSHLSEQGRQDEFSQQLADIRQKHLEFSKILHGYENTTDNNAVSVGVGEYELSTHEKLGSYNTRNTMTIAAHDSETGKTGLLHLSDDSNQQLLKDFFDKFGSDPLEIRLIGVRSGGEALAKYQTSMKNRNDTIISADILGPNDMPRAVVVDPVSFKLEERIPAKIRAITPIITNNSDTVQSAEPYIASSELAKGKAAGI